MPKCPIGSIDIKENDTEKNYLIEYLFFFFYKYLI